ncbi:MAG: formate dehydrogenase subunit gamma [Nitrospirae bacterium GWC2_57_9]|nr:MAG: formate dehydrogenase subunit gamma [Nitrospirae bacterium GWC2_57_9]
MSEKTLVKATTAEIINHWILAVSCILLIITGYGFVFKMEGIYALFGSNTTMKWVHNWTGVIFTFSLAGTLFNYLGEALDLSRDDWNWIKLGGGYLSKKHVQVPPMGKINTGQKLYYLAILAGGFGIAVSGLAIWLLPGMRTLIQVSHLVHNLAFVLFVVAVPAHIYLGTLANPGLLRIMIDGTVPLEVAKKRYPKWMKELGI